MIFKEIRYLIFSPLELIINDEHIENVDTHNPDIDIYNDYEVIGIRSGNGGMNKDRYLISITKTKIVLSLKPPLVKSYDNYLENYQYGSKYNNIEAKGE